MSLQSQKLNPTCASTKTKHSQQPLQKIAQFKYTLCLADTEFVWPSLQTLVSGFDWAGPGILGPAPLILTSPHLHCSLQVSIFCLCHWFVFWSVRVIYLHGIVFLSVPPQEIWNEAGLTLPGPNKARELISCILMLFVKTTHILLRLWEGYKKNTLMVSVVLCFSPTEVSTSSTDFHLEVTCFSNSKLLNGSKWI